MKNKLNTIEAKVKSELGQFLANQSDLLSMEKNLENIRKYKDYNLIKEKLYQLKENQRKVESLVMSWLSKVAQYKDYILKNPTIKKYMEKGEIDTGIFSQSFWGSAKYIISQSIPLINEGIKLSGLMLRQNSEVQTLKKSFRSGKLLKPEPTFALFENSLIWLYGLLGIILAYNLNLKKRRHLS